MAISKLNPEQYLKQFTPEQLLKAAINFYGQYNKQAEVYLKLGFELAGSNGWRHIAPAWISAKTHIKEESS